MTLKGFRASVLFVSFAALTWGGSAAPLASYRPGDAKGLQPISVPDGKWLFAEAAGREAVTVEPGGLYLYFQLDPETRAKANGSLYLLIDFLDAGMGLARLQYNAPGNPYQQGPGYLLINSGKWNRCLWHVDDAAPQGLQNAGADFRIAFAGPVTVASIELHRAKPDVDVPTNKQRLDEFLAEQPAARRPGNMFYTLGNDADASMAYFYKALGVTSIESYVTWETCEGAEKGEWDWSRWDEQVRILESVGLKWVPFLIVGPAYSTPDWFRESSDHYTCRCIAHGTDSKVESLWNPHLPQWIDRFLAAFAERYRDTGVIESVLLGIQGDFGEAIYSVTGGGWTFNIPGEYHNHAGFWCGDDLARNHFRAAVQARYPTLGEVNEAWGTAYTTWDKVGYPAEGEALEAYRNGIADAPGTQRRHWLDFVTWYRRAMTDWSDWWMATTRKHFPKTPIYLCTGGDAVPEHGSNFAEQCRVAAEHRAGVRITNEGSQYAGNFYLTRWVASAGKYYGAYYGFEPASGVDEKGIVARIYNATASGANQLHEYNTNIIGSPTRIQAQQAHFPYFFRVRRPVVPIAMWYPEVSLTFDREGFPEKVTAFRDYVDFDYVDETMLRNGALSRYKALVVIHGVLLETRDAKVIAEWVENGGHLVVMDVPAFESVEGTDEPERLLFGNRPDGSARGRGSTIRLSGWDALANRIRFLLEINQYPIYDLKKDGVYGTQISRRQIMLLNTAKEAREVKVRWKSHRRDSITAPGTITLVSR